MWSPELAGRQMCWWSLWKFPIFSLNEKNGNQQRMRMETEEEEMNQENVAKLLGIMKCPPVVLELGKAVEMAATPATISFTGKAQRAGRYSWMEQDGGFAR